jgi:hypothetical protein
MNKTLKLAGALLAMVGANLAHAVSFDYASLPGSSISFAGDSTFTFSAAPNFSVTDGSASGLQGTIAGSFTIGAVTSNFGLSTAPISGMGSFTILDGATPFLADLTWTNMSQFGTGSTINYSGSINLTNISYSGTNADLVVLANDGVGINVLTFQFSPAVSLANLKTQAHTTSFSGSISSVSSVPDSGASIALLGSALVAMGLIGRRRRA